MSRINIPKSLVSPPGTFNGITPAMYLASIGKFHTTPEILHSPSKRSPSGDTVAMIAAAHGYLHLLPSTWYHEPDLCNISGETVAMIYC